MFDFLKCLLSIDMKGVQGIVRGKIPRASRFAQQARVPDILLIRLIEPRAGPAGGVVS